MKITAFKNTALTLAAGTILTACVVSGHPSTDKNHSHVDTSSTRYDVYDPHYDYHDQTKHLNKKRLYNTHDASEDYDYEHDYMHRDSYYHSRNDRNKRIADKLANDDIRYIYDSKGDAYYINSRGQRIYVTP